MLKVFSLFVTILAAITLFSPATPAEAASYDVSASVPFPAPSQAAVIDPSFNNSTKTTEVVELFGTCENIFPTSIVSIWEGAVLLGSTNCLANNTFRVNISLKPGANTVFAKTSSISNSYGPDSTPATINYVPAPTSQATNQTSLAAASATPLFISTETPVAVMDSGNKVTIQLKIEGGASPYTVTINWGDGTTETKTIAGPGLYSFEHTYSTANIFKVVATVTDVLGASKVYQFIVTSTNPQSATSAKTQSPASKNTLDKKSNATIIVFGIIAIILLFLVIFLSSFWLGRRYEHSHAPPDKKAPKKPINRKRL